MQNREILGLPKCSQWFNYRKHELVEENSDAHKNNHERSCMFTSIHVYILINTFNLDDVLVHLVDDAWSHILT